ncbi:MAG TPA: protein kinase, partial [Kofleriaceae bacterium]
MSSEFDEPTQPSPFRSGEAVRRRWGRYVVLGPLGAGTGGVLAAHDPTLDRKVALKLLRTADTAAAASRLELAAQAMARLAHPNVVAVYEVARADDRMYVAMELVEGTTLRGWLAERPRRWREIVEMCVAAGRGLAAAHAAGLIHRNFKPENVLIGRDGRPRVSDFGWVVETGERAPGELADAESPSAARRGDLITRG